MIEIIDLMAKFRSETEQQLLAIQNEDTEQFLLSIQACDDIVQRIDSLNSSGSEKSEECSEYKKIISEIISIREQISALLPPLKSKLEQHLLNEKRRVIIQQGYGNETYPPPSIFFDKKIK